MPRPIPTARSHRWPSLFATLCAAFLPLQPAASAEITLYEVSVPLQGSTPEDRSAGFAQALRSVAVRVSGRRDAAVNPAVTGADPMRYVQRYSTSAEQVLTVGFDDEAVERLLQQAGLPFWAAERPLTVIDAPGIDDGDLLRAAEWRGLPMARAAGAGAPGAATAVLKGTPGGTAFDWTFSHGGQTAQARGSLQDGIDLAADQLAARYAPPSSRGTSTVVLRVDGMDGLGAYAGLLAYVEGLSIVRDVDVEGLEGRVLRLRLTVRGDRDSLERVAALDGRLVRPGADGAAAPGADLRYEP